MSDDLRDLPVDQIVEPWVLLRPVDTQLVEYLEMRDSIAKSGFLNSISVRACKRSSRKWEVIDGMYRWTCAKDLGLPTIPAIIKENVTDDEVLALQIAANAVRPETQPCEFAAQLRRIQTANPLITLAQIAVMVSKSPKWVGSQLGLLRLSKTLQAMVDRGEICLQNAYTLTKLPLRLRWQFVDDAITMKSSDFTAIVGAALRKFREAVQKGNLDIYYMEGLQPSPHMRNLTVLEEDLKNHSVGPLMVTSQGCKNAIEGWYCALKWVMQLDPESVETQKARLRAKARDRWVTDPDPA